MSNITETIVHKIVRLTETINSGRFFFFSIFGTITDDSAPATRNRRSTGRLRTVYGFKFGTYEDVRIRSAGGQPIAAFTAAAVVVVVVAVDDGSEMGAEHRVAVVPRNLGDHQLHRRRASTQPIGSRRRRGTFGTDRGVSRASNHFENGACTPTTIVAEKALSFWRERLSAQQQNKYTAIQSRTGARLSRFFFKLGPRAGHIRVTRPSRVCQRRVFRNSPYSRPVWTNVMGYTLNTRM